MTKQIAVAVAVLLCSAGALAQGKPTASRADLIREMVILTGGSPASADSLVPLYEMFLTENELREIVAFFGSAAGQKYVETQERIRLASLPLEALQAEALENRLKRTESELRSIASALEVWAVGEGGYPSTSELEVLATRLEPAYIPQLPRTDAWDQPYRYVGAETAYRLVSAGPDGRFSASSLKLGAKPDRGSDDIIVENGQFLSPGP